MNLENDKRNISVADREERKLTFDDKEEIVIKQSSSEDKVRLKMYCVFQGSMSVTKITDYRYNMTFNKPHIKLLSTKIEMRSR